MGMKLIDADIIVTVQFYDDEHGEYNFERMTIADALDCWTEEGCPTEVIIQEPKVLSFAEAMLDTDRDVIWVEFKDDPIVEAAIPGFAVNEYADAYCGGFDSEDGTIRLSAYQCGKIWRPWSLRPTDAQREAVKWE